MSQSNKDDNLYRLYSEFGHSIPTFQMFKEMLKKCTQNYGCLVIDKNSSSDRLDPPVFWYRVDQDKEEFKDPVLWKNNDKYLIGKLNTNEEPEPEHEEETNRRNFTNSPESIFDMID
jgi:hypothetical protein